MPPPPSTIFIFHRPDFFERPPVAKKQHCGIEGTLSPAKDTVPFQGQWHQGDSVAILGQSLPGDSVTIQGQSLPRDTVAKKSQTWTILGWCDAGWHTSCQCSFRANPCPKKFSTGHDVVKLK